MEDFLPRFFPHSQYHHSDVVECANRVLYEVLPRASQIAMNVEQNRVLLCLLLWRMRCTKAERQRTAARRAQIRRAFTSSVLVTVFLVRLRRRAATTRRGVHILRVLNLKIRLRVFVQRVRETRALAVAQRQAHVRRSLRSSFLAIRFFIILRVRAAARHQQQQLAAYRLTRWVRRLFQRRRMLQSVHALAEMERRRRKSTVARLALTFVFAARWKRQRRPVWAARVKERQILRENKFLQVVSFSIALRRVQRQFRAYLLKRTLPLVADAAEKLVAIQELVQNAVPAEDPSPPDDSSPQGKDRPEEKDLPPEQVQEQQLFDHHGAAPTIVVAEYGEDQVDRNFAKETDHRILQQIGRREYEPEYAGRMRKEEAEALEAKAHAAKNKITMTVAVDLQLTEQENKEVQDGVNR